jgi:hypothetical protein
LVDVSDNDLTVKSESEDEGRNDDGATTIPDRENFSLLHSLFSMNEGSNLFNRFINEMVRFNGSRVFTYAKGNNTLGTLLEVPQFRSLKDYGKEFKKDDNILAEICNAVARFAKCDPSEACETIYLHFLIGIKIPF